MRGLSCKLRLAYWVMQARALLLQTCKQGYNLGLLAARKSCREIVDRQWVQLWYVATHLMHTVIAVQLQEILQSS